MKSLSHFQEEFVTDPEVMVLAVFGHHNKRSEDELHEYGITPLVQYLGRLPDKVLLPSEGDSSIYLHEWAEAAHLPTQIFQADWIRHGKIAQVLRDDRMQKECTHAFLLLGPKEKKFEKMAEKLARKGKKVLTLSHTLILTEVVCEKAPDPPSSVPSHKSNKGTMRSWLTNQNSTRSEKEKQAAS